MEIQGLTLSIRIVGAELKLPESAAKLELLRKGDPRKAICAALVKTRTSVKTNGWLMGYAWAILRS